MTANPQGLPGAKPSLPISAGKGPFDNAFIAEAHKYWSMCVGHRHLYDEPEGQ